VISGTGTERRRSDRFEGYRRGAWGRMATADTGGCRPGYDLLWGESTWVQTVGRAPGANRGGSPRSRPRVSSRAGLRRASRLPRGPLPGRVSGRTNQAADRRFEGLGWRRSRARKVPTRKGQRVSARGGGAAGRTVRRHGPRFRMRRITPVPVPHCTAALAAFSGDREISRRIISDRAFRGSPRSWHWQRRSD
jgi:hypothetical protein